MNTDSKGPTAMCCKCYERYPVVAVGLHGPWCPACVAKENARVTWFLSREGLICVNPCPSVVKN